MREGHIYYHNLLSRYMTHNHYTFTRWHGNVPLFRLETSQKCLTLEPVANVTSNSALWPLHVTAGASHVTTSRIVEGFALPRWKCRIQSRRLPSHSCRPVIVMCDHVTLMTKRVTKQSVCLVILRYLCQLKGQTNQRGLICHVWKLCITPKWKLWPLQVRW